MRLLLLCLAAFFFSACGGSAETVSGESSSSGFQADLPALSGEHVWTMDPANSAVTFNANHTGAFTGDFSRFDAAIKLDPANPGTGEIHAVVDLSSVDARDPDRNNNLPLAEWFNTSEFPTATFSSDNITSNGDAFDAAGTLTIKGKSNPVTLSFTLDIKGDTALAQGGFKLDRRDYDIGTGSDFETEDWVKFPVEVNVEITATR